MTSELKYFGTSAETGLTLTATVYNYDATVNTSAIALTEVGTTGRYEGDMPAIAAGDYSFEVFNGSASLGVKEISWDGSAEITLKALNDAIAALNNPTVAAIADAVWDEALSGHQTAGTAGRNLTFAGVILSETTLTGTPTTTVMQLTAGSAIDEFYDDMELYFTSGSAAGLSRIISSYTGATKTVTFDEPLPVTPSASDVVVIRTIHKHTRTQIAQTVRAEMDASSTQLAAIVEDTGTTLPALISGISVGSGVGVLAKTVTDDNASGTNPLNGVTFVGSVASGTFADLTAATGVYLVIDDVANVIDYDCKIQIPANAVPTTLLIDGYLTGVGDAVGIYAYENDTLSWDLEATLQGQTGSDNVAITIPLGDAKYANSNGEVFIRFTTTAGANQQLNLDRILVGYQNQTIGYAEGAVWFDSNASNTNTVSFEDGVADNPVSTLAALNAIGSAVGLSKFHIASNSTVTLAASQDGDVFYGENWTLALGGQSVSGSRFSGASNGVSGACTGTNPFFYECSIGNVTLPPCALQTCGLSGTLTIGSAGDFFFVDCISQVAGAISPTLDMGVAVGATNVSIRRYSGGLTINNLAAGDVVSLDGIFGTITINGTGGQVEIRGISKAVVDNTGGSATVNDDSLKADSLEAILLDTGTDGVVISATVANQLADALLNRNMSLVDDTNSRSPLNALRILRNKYEVDGNTLRVYGEDDSTQKWDSILTTNANASPVTGSDPT